MELLNHTKMLIDERNKKYLIRVTGKFEHVKDLGIIDTSRLIDKNNGDKIEVYDRNFWIIEPTTEDLLEFLERSAQIMSSKDIASILYKCNIRSGSMVVEAGAGSGFMSIALLNTVRPAGKVITYELRPDFAELSRKNIELAGLEKWWTLKLDDIANISEKGVDSAVIDVPEPWTAVPAIHNSLKSSGWLSAYVPTVAQLERTVKILRSHNFVNIEAKEILERKWVVGELGSRPETQMLGHTGFLIFARKV
ncbi:MAG: tRNA (adenine-N1)-methyltransferase [Thermoplasmata archaeon]